MLFPIVPELGMATKLYCLKITAIEVKGKDKTIAYAVTLAWLRQVASAKLTSVVDALAFLENRQNSRVLRELKSPRNE